MHQQHPSSVQVSKSCWGIFPLAISHHPAVTAVTSPPVSSRLENPMDSLHSPSWILHTVAKVVQLWPGPLTSEQGLLLSCVKGPISSITAPAASGFVVFMLTLSVLCSSNKQQVWINLHSLDVPRTSMLVHKQGRLWSHLCLYTFIYLYLHLCLYFIYPFYCFLTSMMYVLWALKV